MFYRYVCLLGSVSLAEGFHLHVRTLPKLAARPMSMAADAPQVSPVSTEEQHGQDLFDWNKQVTSESDPTTRASRRSHDRLVRGEGYHADPLLLIRRANRAAASE